MRPRIRRSLAGTVLLLGAVAPAEGAGPPAVYASFHPLAYFAERLGGERVRVVCPLPEDADPATWTPDRATLRAFQEADLILVNGAGFESWLERVSLPATRLVDTTRPLRDRLLQYEEGIVHSHGPAGEHTHRGIDGHTWLDPRQAAVQAGEVLTGLVHLLPEHEDELRARFRSLQEDLQAVDDELRALGPLPAGEALYANHPAYRYVARRYGWRVVDLDLDPAVVPGDAALADLRARLAEVPGRILLWERAPVPAAAARIRAAVGLESVVFAPGESLSASDRAAGNDFLAILRGNVLRLRAAWPAAPSDPADAGGSGGMDRRGG